MLAYVYVHAYTIFRYISNPVSFSWKIAIIPKLALKPFKINIDLILLLKKPIWFLTLILFHKNLNLVRNLVRYLIARFCPRSFIFKKIQQTKLRNSWKSVFIVNSFWISESIEKSLDEIILICQMRTHIQFIISKLCLEHVFIVSIVFFKTVWKEDNYPPNATHRRSFLSQVFPWNFETVSNQKKCQTYNYRCINNVLSFNFSISISFSFTWRSHWSDLVMKTKWGKDGFKYFCWRLLYR